MKDILNAIRLALPVITGLLAVAVAYELGSRGVDSWWMLVPMLMVGYAIGSAVDRADNRARAELFQIILNALTCGRDTTITVRSEKSCCDQEGCECCS
jgi:uncharacterized membrane protein AbrB (regulator of aidB expression)